VSLSPPAPHARVKRLEAAGLIQKYVAILDREQLGFDLLCFITVSLQIHKPDEVEKFREHVVTLAEVLACYHITGDYDYILKVAVKNRQHLQRFLGVRGLNLVHMGAQCIAPLPTPCVRGIVPTHREDFTRMLRMAHCALPLELSDDILHDERGKQTR